MGVPGHTPAVATNTVRGAGGTGASGNRKKDDTLLQRTEAPDDGAAAEDTRSWQSAPLWPSAPSWSLGVV